MNGELMEDKSGTTLDLAPILFLMRTPQLHVQSVAQSSWASDFHLSCVQLLPASSNYRL
jgi:hypothetical protein